MEKMLDNSVKRLKEARRYASSIASRVGLQQFEDDMYSRALIELVRNPHIPSGILYFRMLDELKRFVRRWKIDQQLVNCRDDVLNIEEVVDLRLSLALARRHLTPPQTRVYDFLAQGFTPTEIAGILGVNQSAISHVMRRIRNTLRTEVGHAGNVRVD